MIAPTMRALPERGFEILPGTPIYTWSSYWRNWSRLIMLGHGGRYLEFSLEPISGYDDWSQDVEPIKLRWHCTSRSSRDKSSTVVPIGLRERMISHLDPEIVEFMLVGDIWSQIDWEKFLSVRNGPIGMGGGGISLDLCLRD